LGRVIGKEALNRNGFNIMQAAGLSMEVDYNYGLAIGLPYWVGRELINLDPL
jgi:hypothetical protein